MLDILKFLAGWLDRSGGALLDILKFLAGWLDRSGGALFIGFALGAMVTFAIMRHFDRRARCYYGDWVESFRQEGRLAAIVAKERQLWVAAENARCAAELIEEDRKKHPPEGEAGK
jgi:hypothetical protein